MAKAAGVSRSTVSFVLNNATNIQIRDETRKRVFEAAQELGYVPDAAARALASRRSKTIGLVIARKHHHISDDAFLNMMLVGFLACVHEHNMRLLVDIVEPDHQQETYLNLARAKHIDGILLAGPRLDDSGVFALEANHFPTVLIGDVPGEFSWVDIDNCAAAEAAVAHLISLGHQRIACITNASTDYPAPAQRLEGYVRAITSAGISYDPALVRYADYDLASGYTQMQSLLESKVPFSAAFVASDVVAFGAKAALAEKQIAIPSQVALVGFDDVPYARYMEPALTTIQVPAVEIAMRACEMLIEMIVSGDLAPRQVRLESKLVVRASCGSI